jgi:quinol-cytochrome oxidoreductase complex cytochrome b subunit
MSFAQLHDVVGGTMNRDKILRILLVLFGLIFVAGVYPLITSIRSGWQANKEEAEPMGISLYITMGIFLLLASRNPSANRGVITFAAWLNIAHAAVMTVMAVHLPNEREGLLIAAAVFGAIGAVLILLAPSRQLGERTTPTRE